MNQYEIFWNTPFEHFIKEFLKTGNEVAFFDLCTRIIYATPKELETYGDYINSLKFKKEADPTSTLTNNELILLGDAYYSGHTISMDYIKAAECFALVKDQPFALYKQALLSYFAKQGEQNYDLAKAMFEMVKEQGIYAGAYRLGEMYQEGKGVEKNSQKALEELLQADSKKIKPVYSRLSAFYREQKSEKDEQNYLEKNFESGDPMALYQLACKYNDPENKEQDNARAIKYFEIASERLPLIAGSPLIKMYMESKKSKDLLAATALIKKAWFSKKEGELINNPETLFEELKILTLGIAAQALSDPKHGLEVLYHLLTTQQSKEDPTSQSILFAESKLSKAPQVIEIRDFILKHFRATALENKSLITHLISKETNPKAAIETLAPILGFSIFEMIPNNPFSSSPVIQASKLHSKNEVKEHKNDARQNNPSISCQEVLRLIGVELPERFASLNKLDVKEFRNFFTNIFMSGSKEDIQEAITFLRNNKNIEFCLPLEYTRGFQQSGFLSVSDEPILRKIQEFRPALSIAASCGQVDTMQALLAAGANPTLPSGMDPVLTNIADVKISEKSVMMAKPSFYISGLPLSIAVTALQPASVATLLKTNKVDPTRALFALANTYSEANADFHPGMNEEKLSVVRIDIAKQLIAAGANVNAIAAGELTRAANSFLSEEEIEELDAQDAKEGKKVDKNECQGFHHVLFDAIRAGDSSLVNLLLPHIKHSVIVTRAISTTHYWDDSTGVIKGLAFTKKSAEMEKIIKMLVEYLIAAKIEKEELNRLLNTLLHEIVHSRYDENIHNTILYLIKQGADPQYGVNDNWTGAIGCPNLPVFELCMQHGASLANSTDAIERLDKKVNAWKKRITTGEIKEAAEVGSFKKSIKEGEVILSHFNNYLIKVVEQILVHLNSYPTTQDKFVTDAKPTHPIKVIAQLRQQLEAYKNQLSHPLEYKEHEIDNRGNVAKKPSYKAVAGMLRDSRALLQKCENPLALQKFEEFFGVAGVEYISMRDVLKNVDKNLQSKTLGIP